MNDLPRQKLAEILAQYSNTIAGDPKRLEGLLNYVTDNECPLEVNLLMDALRDGVVTEISAAPKSVPRSVLLPEIIGRLRDHRGLTDEAATWAVEAWADALGHTTPLKVIDEDVFDPPKIDFEKEAITVGWQISRFPIYLLKQMRLSWRLMFDPRVSILLKMIPILATAYIISPIALIVDLIPLAGLIANIAVYLLALALFNYLAPAEVVKEQMNRIEANDLERRKKADSEKSAKAAESDKAGTRTR